MLNTTNMAFIQSLSQFISSGMSTVRREPQQPSPYILSTSPPDATMELYVLEHKVYVCSIPKDIISHFCLAIIKIALLPNSRPNFFSITETDSEYTLIITEEDFNELPDHERMKSSGYVWRVLTVSVGAMGATSEIVGVSKIAKSVIGPLADHQISVLCLSTYQSDYILVQEPRLDATIRLLGSYFKVFNEDHERVNVAQVLSSSPSTPTADKMRSINHPFHNPSEQYHITGLDASKLTMVIQILLELIFFSGNKEKVTPTFFHFSIVCGDISLIMDNEALEKFPNNVLYTKKNEDIWRMICIGEPNSSLGFEECGIVAQVVEPLASWQVSTYYISAYNLEFCLVLEKDIERILAILEDRKKENIEKQKKLLETSNKMMNPLDLNVEKSAENTDEKEECRPGENMSLTEAIESTDEQGCVYTGLSTSPYAIQSDDSSSYGTSPVQSDSDVAKSSSSNDGLLRNVLSNSKPSFESTVITSRPIPIPPSSSFS